MPPVTIPLPRNFDIDWVLGFLRARALPSMEAVSADRCVRAIRIAGRSITVSACFERDLAPSVVVRSSPEIEPAALSRLARTIFDLDTDLTRFLEMASRDMLLKRSAAARPGLRIPHFVDPFEGMLRAIVGQQVSVRAASTMADRVVRKFGSPAPSMEGHDLTAFPAPDNLLCAGPAGIIALGLTRAKAAAVFAIAQAAAEGRLDIHRLRDLPSDAVERDLCAIRGVGPWTAAYFRMRTLGDADACPMTDLGLVKAVRSLSRGGQGLSQADIVRRTERWRPWRAYGTVHLWASGVEARPTWLRGRPASAPRRDRRDG